MIACSHPGKIGDALYSLPAMRKISEMTGEKIDFYTSNYCKPLKRLIEYQSYINGFYIPDKYKIERMDMGIQPWRMPIDLNFYDKVYQLGFRSVPDRALPNFISVQAGVPIAEIRYDYKHFYTYNKPYIIIAPKGHTSYENLFVDFIKACPLECVIIGSEKESIGNYGINMCGLDFLETTTWVANSVGFLGLQSSQLALANGFNIPKVAVHDGVHWDMRHVIKSNTNFYPVNPTIEQLLNIFGV